MIVVIWRYRVRMGRESAFERVYGPRGDWAVLFRRAAGYITTELLQDASAPRLYLTIDRWQSETAYHAFRERQSQEYEALDAHCAALTESEEFLGTFLFIA